MPEATPTKVRATHLQRDAFLYVRQSTLQQVVHNTESTQRQYALRQRAIALGWPSAQVHVIDCDLGQSGAAAADRAGFQQLVTEVSLGHAGIVLGLEVSRLARNSTDWHRLLELCALADTLILDEDGLYDCNDFNDRLLLGLKGTLSEAELHFLRARLRGGLLNKARRGELVGPLPVGFVYDDQEHVQLDPDTQVQAAVRLLFTTFRRTGTAYATIKYFREQGLQFPRRLKTGLRKGELVWGVLSHARTLQVLHNPRYAGAFFFGRTRTRLGPHGAVQYGQKDRQDWVALIPDAHPGYIPWDEYEDNQRRLLAGAQAHGHDRRKSPPGEGPALLQGFAVCGICGRRMSVRYHERQGRLVPDYTCLHTRIDLAEPSCQIIPGQAIDRAIEQLALEMMTPVSLEMALAVQQELQERQQEAEQLRAKQVERAQYEADLARQRYLRCDPNNRLVASTLEADWNAALRALEQAQTECEQQRQQAAALVLTDEVRARVMALTTDFPAVWRAPQTTDRDRKRMLRLLLEDVTLLKTASALTLQVRFRGGSTQTLTLPAPQTSWQSWTTPPEVITEIDRLLEDYTEGEIAAALNQRGWRSGKGESFSTTIIARLRKVHGLTDRYTRLRARGLLTVEEIATKLGVCPKTVKHWRNAGLLVAHAYTDKPECLYELPTGGTLPTKQQGRKLSTRSHANPVIPNPAIEVQHES